MNVLEKFNIESSEYIDNHFKHHKIIKLRTRALIFLLDYSLFALLIYGTYEFIGLFNNNIASSIFYALFAFYSIIFIAIEYYFDGTIFKVLFNIRSVSLRGKKLGLHIYVFKFLILRPIALILAAIYMNLVTSIILWIFGVQKMFFRFLEGHMDSIWYDKEINQIVIKIPMKNV